MKTLRLPCYSIVIELFGGRDDTAGTIKSELTDEGVAMDAIESLILAHACAGVDVKAPKYIEGIETAVEACWNRE